MGIGLLAGAGEGGAHFQGGTQDEGFGFSGQGIYSPAPQAASGKAGLDGPRLESGGLPIGALAGRDDLGAGGRQTEEGAVYAVCGKASAQEQVELAAGFVDEAKGVGSAGGDGAVAHGLAFGIGGACAALTRGRGDGLAVALLDGNRDPHAVFVRGVALVDANGGRPDFRGADNLGAVAIDGERIEFAAVGDAHGTSGRSQVLGVDGTADGDFDGHVGAVLDGPGAGHIGRRRGGRERTAASAGGSGQKGQAGKSNGDSDERISFGVHKCSPSFCVWDV